jgi:HAMP domain-containing protein
MVRHFKLGHLKLASQFTLLLSLIFIGGIALGGFALSQALEQKAEMEIAYRGQITMQIVDAVRSYTIEQIVPLVSQMNSSQRFIPEINPSYAARQVFETFKENWKYKDFMYKDATLNPTNLADRADRFEARLVEKFESDRTVKSLSGFRNFSGDKLFYIAQPLAVTSPKCLKCHSTPANAPKSHVEQYGSENGYGWELNQVIGTQVMYVPASEVSNNARQALFLFISIFIGIFALVIVAINYLLKKRVIQPLKPMALLAQTISRDTVSATEVRALEGSGLAKVSQRTDELGQLGRVFDKMVREVYIREQQLAEQLKQLRVEIDQSKVIHQVAEIEESDYFQNLKKSAKEIRNQWKEGGVGNRE